MFNRLSRHVRQQFVGYVALFVALGGVSYAAAELPKNSVGAAQIKAGAVSSSKVKDGSLLAHDFERGQLPRGATGAQGPAGVPGAQGPQGVPGPQGIPGANGSARAYGSVSAQGVVDTTESSAGVTVIHVEAGHYCVNVPGITQASAVIVPVMDFDYSSAGDTAANWNSGCPGFGVATFNAAGTQHDAGFDFVIP